MNAINPCLTKYHFPVVPKSILLLHVFICGSGDTHKLTWYFQKLHIAAEEYFLYYEIHKSLVFAFYINR